MNFDLQIDPPVAARDVEASIRDIVLSRLRRKGVVVGLSGGVDSSVVAALSARALGPERVLALLMPEADSSVAGRVLLRSLTAEDGHVSLRQRP
jgi:NAD+ synthase